MAHGQCPASACGRPVADSPVGPGRVTGVSPAGFPRVDYIAVAWVVFADTGEVFDPYGVRSDLTNFAHDLAIDPDPRAPAAPLFACPVCGVEFPPGGPAPAPAPAHSPGRADVDRHTGDVCSGSGRPAVVPRRRATPATDPPADEDVAAKLVALAAQVSAVQRAARPFRNFLDAIPVATHPAARVGADAVGRHPTGFPVIPSVDDVRDLVDAVDRLPAGASAPAPPAPDPLRAAVAAFLALPNWEHRCGPWLDVQAALRAVRDAAKGGGA